MMMMMITTAHHHRDADDADADDDDDDDVDDDCDDDDYVRSSLAGVAAPAAATRTARASESMLRKKVRPPGVTPEAVGCVGAAAARAGPEAAARGRPRGWRQRLRPPPRAAPEAAAGGGAHLVTIPARAMAAAPTSSASQPGRFRARPGPRPQAAPPASARVLEAAACTNQRSRRDRRHAHLEPRASYQMKASSDANTRRIFSDKRAPTAAGPTGMCPSRRR